MIHVESVSEYDIEYEDVVVVVVVVMAADGVVDVGVGET